MTQFRGDRVWNRRRQGRRASSAAGPGLQVGLLMGEGGVAALSKELRRWQRMWICAGDLVNASIISEVRTPGQWQLKWIQHAHVFAGDTGKAAASSQRSCIETFTTWERCTGRTSPLVSTLQLQKSDRNRKPQYLSRCRNLFLTTVNETENPLNWGSFLQIAVGVGVPHSGQRLALLRMSYPQNEQRPARTRGYRCCRAPRWKRRAGRRADQLLIPLGHCQLPRIRIE